jgi:ribulose 1,5-bisphosphate synthetase/thiazole synthase
MVVIEDYESRARQVVINWGKMVAECKRLESELVKGNAVIRAQGDENARLHSTLKYLNEVCDDLQRKARGKKSLVVDANGRSVSGLYPNEGN